MTALPGLHDLQSQIAKKQGVVVDRHLEPLVQRHSQFQEIDGLHTQIPDKKTLRDNLSAFHIQQFR